MNPFKVLHIGPDADAQEIMQAAARALREKQYSAREIAEARRQLMEPATRSVLAFLYAVDLTPLLQPEESKNKQLQSADLKRLEIFD